MSPSPVPLYSSVKYARIPDSKKHPTRLLISGVLVQ